MKFRNPGGFKLPPNLPSSEEGFQRAVQLLGHRTQGYLTASKVIELIKLIGAYPLDKETAQRWKGALELYEEKQWEKLLHSGEQDVSIRPQRYYVYRNGEVVGSVLYSKYMDMISLPYSDKDVSHAFHILGLYRARGFLLEEEKTKLKNLINYIPKRKVEAVRVTNALRRLADARKSYERKPPIIPEGDEIMQQVITLLEKVERYGSAGVESDEIIKKHLQGFPRTQSVAKWWYKHLTCVQRVRERKRTTEERRQMVEQVRMERKQKKALKWLDILNSSYRVSGSVNTPVDTFFYQE
eukprot:jgi/Galph1/3837/GphlegSOOS_G2459.1